MDAEMKQLRNARWDRAFQESADADESHDDAVNRKATIVIEHLIQASDVAHTMQVSKLAMIDLHAMKGRLHGFI
jgi:hypothetical protein